MEKFIGIFETVLNVSREDFDIEDIWELDGFKGAEGQSLNDLLSTVSLHV